MQEEEASYYEYDEEEDKSNSVIETPKIGDNLSSIPVLRNNNN